MPRAGTETSYLSLYKPDGDEDAMVSDINSNSEKIDTAVGIATVIASVSSLATLPYSISNSKITSGHVVVNAVLSNPAAQPSDWSFTTSDGSVTISGTISGTTNVTLYLAKVY